MKYRRLKHSDTWHYHPHCQHWIVHLRDGAVFAESKSKPKSGEFCNECRAKTRRDKEREATA